VFELGEGFGGLADDRTHLVGEDGHAGIVDAGVCERVETRVALDRRVRSSRAFEEVVGELVGALHGCRVRDGEPKRAEGALEAALEGCLVARHVEHEPAQA
jgi:hypothetical protein